MKPLKSPRPLKELRNTISYFAFFSFAPDFEQIFTFFPEKTDRNTLLAHIAGLVKAKKLVSSGMSASPSPATPGLDRKKAAARLQNLYIYTLPQYRMHLAKRAVRREITRRKLRYVFPYLKALSLVPAIRFAGISGSAAMENCREQADVDLCIVTARNLLFTGRFWAVLLAGLYRLRHSRGVCLNLFFDEGDLEVPLAKRSLYVAHEALQLQPVFDKDRVYERFRLANRWTEDFFPNAVFRGGRNTANSFGAPPFFLRLAEFILKTIQLRIIRKNATGHLISPTQLWLFRHDYKMRLKSQ